MKRILLVGICMILLILTATACRDQTPSNFPVTVRNTTIMSYPTSVISLTPAATEMLDAIGAAALLTAVSDSCDYPDIIQSLPQIGTAQNPDEDKIIHLKPDLIITTSALEYTSLQRFAMYAIPVLTISPASNLEQLRANYTDLGTAVGGAIDGKANGERAYQALTDMMRQFRQGIQKEIRACYMLSDGVTATADTLVGQLLEQIGAYNIARNHTQWHMSDQEIVSERPQIIFCTAQSYNGVIQNPLFADLPAVVNHQVFIIDPAPLDRQGSRLTQALAEMHTILCSQ